ncbi:MAG: hypothetical protein WAV09_01945 [Minisyncoccia bacterium]
MRLLTTLRRFDNTTKDKIILVTCICLTCIIAVGGFLFTNSSFYSQLRTSEQISGASAIDILIEDAKTNIVPTVKDMQENIDTVSEEYKKGSFKDFFVPKSE